MAIDFRTPSQIKLDEKHKKVCKRFLQLRSEFPDVAQTRLLAHIAKDYMMSTEGVKKICKKHGIYKPKARA